MINLKIKKEPLFHIAKRSDMPVWQSWLVRIAAIAVALVACGVISSIFKSGSFAEFFTQVFKGTFGTPRRIINLFQATALLLIIALAVTPAFKMKFWNIGAEGQVLMSALLCATCMKFFGGKMDDSLLIVVMLIFSIGAGAIWAVIPAIFKAKFNTNETLFTLMMNYIAMGLIAYCITVWVPSGSGVVGILRYGHLPKIGNYPYILNIILVAALAIVMFVYLRYSKHGYELSVVGESENTARYIGINVKKVIVRTMLLSGALCGIAGWLIVSGSSYTISTTIVDGRGFTAILVSWLAHFNPLVMAGTAFLVSFLDLGSTQAATAFGFGGSFPEIITAVFFFCVIASEFFVNYKLKFRLKIPKIGGIVKPKSAAKADSAPSEATDKSDGEADEIIDAANASTDADDPDLAVGSVADSPFEPEPLGEDNGADAAADKTSQTEVTE